MLDGPASRGQNAGERQKAVRMIAMDAMALRNWGVAVAAAAMAGALLLAIRVGDPVAAPAGADIAAGPLLPAAPAATRPDFIVQFDGAHALGRAQTLARIGRAAEAETAAARHVSEDPALAGFCFNRFTVGGDAVVLQSCTAIHADEHADMLARLQRAPGVANAEPAP